MKTKLIRLVSIALALILAALEPAAAENAFSPDTGSPTATSPTRTDSRILYHNGPVLLDTQIIYIVWYGNWATRTYEQLVIADFLSHPLDNGRWRR